MCGVVVIKMDSIMFNWARGIYMPWYCKKSYLQIKNFYNKVE